MLPYKLCKLPQNTTFIIVYFGNRYCLRWNDCPPGVAALFRKKQDKSMNRDEGSYQLSHTSMITYCLPQRHMVDNRSDEGSSGCQNVNKNNSKGCIL